jgi:hypothetical protein
MPVRFLALKVVLLEPGNVFWRYHPMPSPAMPSMTGYMRSLKRLRRKVKLGYLARVG